MSKNNYLSRTTQFNGVDPHRGSMAADDSDEDSAGFANSIMKKMTNIFSRSEVEGGNRKSTKSNDIRKSRLSGKSVPNARQNSELESQIHFQVPPQNNNHAHSANKREVKPSEDFIIRPQSSTYILDGDGIGERSMDSITQNNLDEGLK